MSNTAYRWKGGLVVDNFAGGGGASTGIFQAIGRSPDIAVNHNAEALLMHEKNHADTQHFNESVWDIDIPAVCAGRPVLMGWFSPDCTHFSVAKGGKPVKKSIRGLAWIVKKWAGQADMAQIFMENVVEFMTWGPLIAARCKDTGRVLKLVPDGKDRKGQAKFKTVVAEPGERVPYREQALVPDKKRAGKTFRQFVAQLRLMGYQVEWSEKGLVGSDYGAPTTRKRFFLIARKDGLPIVWPEKTHANPKTRKVQAHKLEPWQTAGENLDWSLPCKSIFDEDRRPLAENTLRRIAKGIEKFVIGAGDNAFLVKTNHGYDQFRGQSLGEPLQTITGKLGTGVAAVSLVPTGYGEREGQGTRMVDINSPLPTIVGTGKHAAVQCQLQEASFIATVDHASTKDTSTGMGEPLTTVTSKARHLKVAALLKHFTGVVGQDLRLPLPTITATDHNSVMEADLVASNLIKLKGSCNHGQGLDQPIDTIAAQGNHFAQVQAFLVKFFSTGDNVASLNHPLATITSKDTFGLVTIHGVDYQIVDIGMRMLEPHELYRCQGFPQGYIHDFINPATGKPLPKHAQVRMVGNSVPPALAKALVSANIPPWALDPEEALTA